MPSRSSFPQPGLERRWKHLPGQPVADGGDPYTGYDRFGRTEEMLWGRPQEGGGFEKLVEVQWGYDRASLKTWRKDLLAPASTGQDQHFGYDGLYQVSQRQRGLLNTSATAIGGIPAQREDFSYDETGNWVSYRQDNSGELDIDQSRVNNRSNQITQVDGSSAGVSYDKNGNMLTVPTSEALTGPSRKLVWDAWNRLREVRDAEDTLVASYQYDAATRRTVGTTGEGEGAVTRHFYYNDQWRSVEERLDSSTPPERQQVWHPVDRYELLLRDRSTSNDGEMDERLYPMKDQLDPVAVCDASGVVVERYAYSAFGLTTFLNADFTPLEGNASSLFWNFLFHAEFSDPATGWFNYGFRYYLPEMGRWPSRDPIGEKGGINLYEMIGSDAVNRRDVLGLKDCRVKDITISQPSVAPNGAIIWSPIGKDNKLSLVGNQGNTRDRANFKINAEFEKPDCGCCEIRQYVKTKPGDKFKEDVDDKGGAYGHRERPGHTTGGVAGTYPDAYYDRGPMLNGEPTRIPNQLHGSHYEGTDNPATNDSGTWTFEVRVIDTCNGNREVAKRTFTVVWP